MKEIRKPDRSTQKDILIQEEFDQGMKIDRQIMLINKKWNSPDLDRKLASGDMETVLNWERDHMYQRELRHGLLER